MKFKNKMILKLKIKKKNKKTSKKQIINNPVYKSLKNSLRCLKKKLI